MKLSKVNYSIGPVLLVIAFSVISYVVSESSIVRTWGNILMLGSIELFFFYLISRWNMNVNKKRFMCSVLALQFTLYTTTYSLLTWCYVKFKVGVVDWLHDIVHEAYGTVSIVVCLLLLVIAACPEGMINGISRSLRVNFYLSWVNNKLGCYIFSIDKDTQK